MAWFDYLWLEGEEGNIEHIAQHDLTPEEVQYVIEHYSRESVSHSSGRPVRFGYTPDGRYIAVVFECIDETTLYPITAFETED